MQDNTIPNAFSKEMAEGIAGAKLVVLAELRTPAAAGTA